MDSRSESLPDCRPFSKNCLPGNCQAAATLRHTKAVSGTVGGAGLASVLVRPDLGVYGSLCGCCFSFASGRPGAEWHLPGHTLKGPFWPKASQVKGRGWLWKRWMKALGRTNWLVLAGQGQQSWEHLIANSLRDKNKSGFHQVLLLRALCFL